MHIDSEVKTATWHRITKYKDDSSGNIVMVELDQDYRALVRCFKVFVRMKIDEGKPIHQDWQNLTIKKPTFKHFLFKPSVSLRTT
jgi:hypothetical protein